MVSKKIFIIGPPAAGKTCITKAFFEGEQPDKLLSDFGSPEPTLGVEHYKCAWIDTDIGVLDSSGQEMSRFLDGEDIEKEMSFGSSDAIVYVFDIEDWMKNSKEILTNLKKAMSVQEKYAPNARMFSFCHKIDLIAIDPEERVKIFEDVKKKIQKDLGIKVVFTSIDPNFIHTLFRSMQIILNDLSKKGTELEQFIKDLLLKGESSALILLNRDYRVISERRSDDISVLSMYNVINFVKSINKSFSKIKNGDFLAEGIVKSYKGNQVIIRGLKNNKYSIAFVIIFSEKATLKTVDRVLEFIGSS
ncbi:MAG: hypothetical protein GF364_13850 [Candidatus Lokiarchaeota archaeon]|nr:hypothetical protein [Candidatus Lokiarchaeota archaeon]